MYTPPESFAEQKLQAVYTRLFNEVGVFAGSYIAGGAIASLILDQAPNDYDVWFENLTSWEKAVSLAKSAIPPVRIVCETEHALTFKLESGELIQFVKSRLGVGEEVAEQFDFCHAQAYFYPVLPEYTANDEDFFSTDGEIVFCGKNCVDIIQDKILLFEGVLDYPIHTLSRLQKFALRGYQIPDQTIANIVLAIVNADPELVQRDIRACGAKYSTGPGKALTYATVPGAKVSTSTFLDEEPSDFDADPWENDGGDSF